MKEEIGLIGILILGVAGMICGYVVEITVPAVVALIAYIGGNHNGETRNSRLEPPL
jgi:uncharacterized membrane protein